MIITSGILEMLLEHEARYFAMVANVEKTPVAWYMVGPELPGYGDANRALHLRDDGRGAAAVAAEVVAALRSRVQRVVVDLDAVAEAQGIGAALRRMDVLPVTGDRVWMRYRGPSTREFRTAENVTVHALSPSDEVGRSLWIETAMADTRGDEDEAMWQGVTEREARFPLCRLYLGYLDGQAAGTCDLFESDGWGRIEAVATPRPFRRRGVASAVVGQAVADSAAAGNAVTFLTTDAGSDAERLYLRLGFERWGLNILHRHLGL